MMRKTRRVLSFFLSVLMLMALIPATGLTNTTEGKPLGDPVHTAAHKTEIVPATNGTCTEEGFTEGVYCTECKAFVSGHTAIPATGHTFAEPILAADATCTAPGLMGGICIMCGKAVLNPTGKAPHADANHDSVCDVCGVTLYKNVGTELIENRNGTVKIALVAYGCEGMTGGETEFSYDPACVRLISQEPGQDIVICRENGGDAAVLFDPRNERTYQFSFLFQHPLDGSLGEDLDSFELAYFTFELSDPEAASTQFWVSLPGIKGFTAAPPLTVHLRHRPADGTERVLAAATCGKEGIRSFACKDCVNQVAGIIPATGAHTWDEGVVTLEPKVDEDGERTFTCTVCGETKREVIQGIPGFSPINTDHAREKGEYVYVLQGTKAAEVLEAIGVNSILKPDGSEMKAGDILASGMTVRKTNADRLTVVVLGDINGDGKITAADARLALRQAVGLDRPKDWEKAAALVTGGEKVSAKDARKILRIAVGLDQPVLTAN